MTRKSKSKTAARKRAATSKKRTATTAKTSTHTLVWRDVTCRVRHTPTYLSKGWSHIEIIVQRPKGAPLPITQSGYCSHFLDQDQLATAGGPVRFFQEWIEREARSKTWHQIDFRSRQGDLFAVTPPK